MSTIIFGPEFKTSGEPGEARQAQARETVAQSDASAPTQAFVVTGINGDFALVGIVTPKFGNGTRMGETVDADLQRELASWEAASDQDFLDFESSLGE
jgi:hypothetical protein